MKEKIIQIVFDSNQNCIVYLTSKGRVFAPVCTGKSEWVSPPNSTSYQQPIYELKDITPILTPISK